MVSSVHRGLGLVKVVHFVCQATKSEMLLSVNNHGSDDASICLHSFVTSIKCQVFDLVNDFKVKVQQLLQLMCCLV